MKDKFVKLAAIEKMAKPMAAFHKNEEPEMDEEYESEESECECPKCGHKYMHGSEEEYEEEYEEED